VSGSGSYFGVTASFSASVSYSSESNSQREIAKAVREVRVDLYEGERTSLNIAHSKAPLSILSPFLF
jgi:hypothetical protein